MKSKKIILGIALIVILVVGGIALNNSSKDSSSDKKESSTTTETNSDSNKPQSTKPEDSAKPSTEASTNTENNATPSDNTNNSNSSASTNDSFSPQDAAAKIIKYYFGEESIAKQHFTPISIEGNTTKKQDNSTIIYSDSEEFTDGKSDGTVIFFDNYNESTKTYNYSIKDLHSLVDGTDFVLSSGTVSSDGTVTENQDDLDSIEEIQ